MADNHLFEVWKNGVLKMSTDYAECIPTKEEIAAMKKAGYKIVYRRKQTRAKDSMERM